MQTGSDVSSGAQPPRADCVFCQGDAIASYILTETQNFRLVADHAPLVEGHLLIIPKQHFACYGAVPGEFDAEFFGLRAEVQRFFQENYLPPVFWEHGIFHQSVFHAHLHCFPFGPFSQKQHNLCEELAAKTLLSQDMLRQWYVTKGQYFYLEPDKAFLFAAVPHDYMQITQGIFWPKVSQINNQKIWHSTPQRVQEGIARVEAVQDKWHRFEQKGVSYASETRS